MVRREEVVEQVSGAIRERLRLAGIPMGAVEYPPRCWDSPHGLRLDVDVEDPLRLGVEAHVAKALAVVAEFLPDFVWKRYGMIETSPSHPLELSGKTYGRSWGFRVKNVR